MTPLQSKARTALEEAVKRWGLPKIAEEFNVDSRTIMRWKEGSIPHPGMVFFAANGLLHASQGESIAKSEGQFTFIDLFAGIGGTRIGFERAGGRCVFTSEWDRFANETYRANFNLEHPIAGDIWKVDLADIPSHDILVGGFPCQPFSIAGVSKKNSLGRAHGFKDKTQGTLFHRIVEILDAKRPAAFLLENVKNLRSHDKGRTFEVIKGRLRELGYQVTWKIIDGGIYTPQHRERIYIVGFRDATAFHWDQVNLSDPSSVIGRVMKDILHPQNGTEPLEKDYLIGPKGKVNPKYTLSAKLWNYLQAYAEKHRIKGNGFGFGLVEENDTCRTLSARYYKDGSEILISMGKHKRPRRLTPRECARIMGFPEEFEIPVSDTQAYKQFGNSVVVPVIESIAKAMTPYVVTLTEHETEKDQLAMIV